MANMKNLSSGTLYNGVSASATTLAVFCGNGSDTEVKSVWPTAPFLITVMPGVPVAGVPNSMDSEIMRVTAVGNDNLGNALLTVVRAQEGTTAKAFEAGAVVTNGVYSQDLSNASAVGKSFFTATLNSGTFYITDDRLTNAPANGDSIKVVFGSDWTSGACKLSLNNGTSYNVYAGNNLKAGAGSATTNALVKSGVIYELTYYNAAWYILNLVADGSVVSGSIDLNTMRYLEPLLPSLVSDNGTFEYDIPQDAWAKGGEYQYFFLSNHIFQPFCYVINTREVSGEQRLYYYKVYGFSNGTTLASINVQLDSTGKKILGTVTGQCLGMLYGLRNRFV